MGNTEEKALSPWGGEQVGWKSERWGPLYQHQGDPAPE